MENYKTYSTFFLLIFLGLNNKKKICNIYIEKHYCNINLFLDLKIVKIVGTFICYIFNIFLNVRLKKLNFFRLILNHVAACQQNIQKKFYE